MTEQEDIATIQIPDFTKKELQNIFSASCVESAAEAEGVSSAEMYERMKAVNLFSELIYPCYETLHTQSRKIVTEDVLEALHRREAKKGVGE